MRERELIAIGASWGGLAAVGTLLSGLPAGLTAPIVVVQHRGADSRRGMLERLWARRSSRSVIEIDDKDSIRPGTVHVAPADYHLLVEHGRFELSVDEVVKHSRPSIDVTFESAADAYRERLVAVLLTGANEDGAAGIRRVADLGGVALVQDPESAERAAMPQAAIDTGVRAEVLPLERIAARIAELCAGDRSAA